MATEPATIDTSTTTNTAATTVTTCASATISRRTTRASAYTSSASLRIWTRASSPSSVPWRASTGTARWAETTSTIRTWASTTTAATTWIRWRSAYCTASAVTFTTRITLTTAIAATFWWTRIRSIQLNVQLWFNHPNRVLSLPSSPSLLLLFLKYFVC